METRRITVDMGEDRNVVLSIQTRASAVEIISGVKTLGYLVFPAGAPRLQGGEETRLPREAYVLLARIVQVE